MPILGYTIKNMMYVHTYTCTGKVKTCTYIKHSTYTRISECVSVYMFVCIYFPGKGAFTYYIIIEEGGGGASINDYGYIFLDRINSPF